MRVVVLMADKDPFTGAAHAMGNVMFFKATKAGLYRGIFFRLSLFRAKGIV